MKTLRKRIKNIENSLRVKGLEQRAQRELTEKEEISKFGKPLKAMTKGELLEIIMTPTPKEYKRHKELGEVLSKLSLQELLEVAMGRRSLNEVL